MVLFLGPKRKGFYLFLCGEWMGEGKVALFSLPGKGEYSRLYSSFEVPFKTVSPQT